MAGIKHKTRAAGTKINTTAVWGEDHEIEAGAIPTAGLANLSVTTAKLADDSVTSAKIAPDTIIAADIAAGAVGTSELADNSVTLEKTDPNMLQALGLKWFCGSYILLSGVAGTKRVAPNMLNDPAQMIYKDADTFIIADMAENSIYELTRNYVINWEYTGTKAIALDYSPELNRVIAVVDGWGPPVRIIELNAATGALIGGHSITASSLGAFGTGTVAGMIKYNKLDPTHFYFCDHSKHVVMLIGWDGVVDWQFGVYNTLGTDDTHLNWPRSVDVYYHLNATRVVIGDGSNHRVLVITKSDNSINSRFPFPYPVVTINHKAGLWGINECGAVFNASLTEPSYILGADDFAPYYHFPRRSNCFAFHPTDPYIIMMTMDWSLYEYDIRQWKNLWHTPYRKRFWDAEAMTLSTNYHSDPVWDAGYERKTILVRPTQAGTLTIQVPSLTKWCATWDGITWADYASLTLVGNIHNKYVFTDKVDVFRVRVNLNITGTTDGWVILE